jgi:FtsH-binding integral membrane protein
MNIASRQVRIYKGYYIFKETPMKSTISMSEAVARPFLLPGNLACSALGLSNHQDLFRMLINSLFWTVLGVIVVVLAT